jgi:Fuseless
MFTNHADYVIDVLWSSTVVCPLIIIYWSGTWRLLDLIFASSDELHSAVFCMIIGFIILFAGYEILPRLEEIAGVLNGICHLVVSRSFLYIYAFGMIAYWRGVWNCAELWAGEVLCSF